MDPSAYLLAISLAISSVDVGSAERAASRRIVAPPSTNRDWMLATLDLASKSRMPTKEEVEARLGIVLAGPSGLGNTYSYAGRGIKVYFGRGPNKLGSADAKIVGSLSVDWAASPESSSCTSLQDVAPLLARGKWSPIGEDISKAYFKLQRPDALLFAWQREPVRESCVYKLTYIYTEGA